MSGSSYFSCDDAILTVFLIQKTRRCLPVRIWCDLGRLRTRHLNCVNFNSGIGEWVRRASEEPMLDSLEYPLLGKRGGSFYGNEEILPQPSILGSRNGRGAEFQECFLHGLTVGDDALRR